MSIFAHLAGIDEVGIYVIPIVLAIVSLRWAEKRSRSAAEEKEKDTSRDRRGGNRLGSDG